MRIKFWTQPKKPEIITRQNPLLYIAKSRIHGLGVFSNRTVQAGVILEKCPIIKALVEELAVREFMVLNYYPFMIDEENKYTGFALGYGSLYNHASDNNATFYFDKENELLIFESIVKIQKHEEITINYLGPEAAGRKIEYWLQKPELSKLI